MGKTWFSPTFNIRLSAFFQEWSSHHLACEMMFLLFHSNWIYKCYFVLSNDEGSQWFVSGDCSNTLLHISLFCLSSPKRCHRFCLFELFALFICLKANLLTNDWKLLNVHALSLSLIEFARKIERIFE